MNFFTCTFSCKSEVISIRGNNCQDSVNICSLEGNSAGNFVNKVSPGIFVIKERCMPIIFGGGGGWGWGKTAVLGAIKGQLPSSEGKYQLVNS